MHKGFRGIFFGIAALMAACSLQPDMVVISDVDNSDWSDMATVKYLNNELDECDMSIVLHVNPRFKPKHLTLEITMLTPDSLRLTEQVRFDVEHSPQRKTLAATDVEIPYRRNLKLKHKGQYVWQITPSHSIEGVESAGIKFQANN